MKKALRSSGKKRKWNPLHQQASSKYPACVLTIGEAMWTVLGTQPVAFNMWMTSSLRLSPCELPPSLSAAWVTVGLRHSCSSPCWLHPTARARSYNSSACSATEQEKLTWADGNYASLRGNSLKTNSATRLNTLPWMLSCRIPIYATHGQLETQTCPPRVRICIEDCKALEKAYFNDPSPFGRGIKINFCFMCFLCLAHGAQPGNSP